MKKSLTVSCLAIVAVGGFTFWATSLKAQPPATLVHLESSFDLLFKAPYPIVAPLFGAEGERAWAGAEWDPHFAFPSPVKDTSGAVFTIEHGGHKQFWITPLYDLPGRHIQHITVIADAILNKLDITFPDGGPDLTKVHVVYARTALRPEFNQTVEHAASQDSNRAHEWQEAIEKYLKSKGNN